MVIGRLGQTMAWISQSTAKYREQMAQFLVRVVRVLQGGGDFELHQLGESGREPVEPDRHGCTRGIEPLCGLFVVTGGRGTVQKRFEDGKNDLSPGGLLLVAQFLQRFTEHRDGPRQFVRLTRIQIRVGDGGKFPLAVSGSERDETYPATPFHRCRTFALVADKISERTDEITAKPTAGGVRSIKKITRYQMKEKFLRRVLGVCR